MAERMPQFEYKEFQGIQLPNDFTVVNPYCEPIKSAADGRVQHKETGEQPNVDFSGHAFVPSARVSADAMAGK